MNTSLYINLIGLFISIIGALVMYQNSPSNFHTIDGGDFTDDNTKNEEKINKKNKHLRCGFLILFFGNLIQLVSVICQICSNQS